MQSLCSLLWQFNSKQKLKYHRILPHVLLLCTRIKNHSLTHYVMAMKNCQVCADGTEKCTAVPPIMLTETLLSSAIFQKVLQALYTRFYVVMHPCSIFFLCTATWHITYIDYKISNHGFSNFLRTCYCDFVSSVYR